MPNARDSLKTAAIVLILATPSTALASSSRDAKRAEIEADGWHVAWGKEIDHLTQLRCTAELLALGPGALVDCAREAILASVSTLGQNIVIQAFHNMGPSFVDGDLEVQADLATYNNWHKECPGFRGISLPCFRFPEPNTYQPYIRWRPRAPERPRRVDPRWLVDVNGDGNADFCRAASAASGSLACSLSVASSSSSSQDTVVPINDWGYADRRWFADVNGDGKADFCRAVGNPSGEGSYLACSLSIQTSGANDIMVPIADWGYADRRWFADVNGDGKADFCRAVGNPSGEGSYLACSLSIASSSTNDIVVPIADWGYADRRWFADVNGDGRADFCRAVGDSSGEGSYLACSLSIASSSTNDTMVPIADWGYADRRWLVDVNGDGKADFCRAVGNSSGEDSYLACSLFIEASGANDTMAPISDWGHADRWLADVTGDGMADFSHFVPDSSGSDGTIDYRVLGTPGTFGQLLRGEELIVMRPDAPSTVYSDPGWATASLTTAAGNKFGIIRDDELVVMKSIVDLPHSVYGDSGWRDARLMEGAGDRLGIIRGDELVVMKTTADLPHSVYSDTGWRTARLMAGAGSHLGIIRGDELVVMKTTADLPRAVYGDAGWITARLMAGAGSHLGIIRGDELVVMKTTADLPHAVYDDPGWRDARLMAGAGSCLGIIRGDELVVMKTNTDTPVAVYGDTGWRTARFMFGVGSLLFIVRDDELVVMKTTADLPHSVYGDTGWRTARRASSLFQ